MFSDSMNARRKNMLGMSMVELLVALTIGLFIAGAAYATYFSTRGSFSTRAAVGKMQENIRFAFASFSKDIRMAGYAGCAVLNGSVNSTLNAVGTGYDYNFSQGVIGHQASGSAWTPTLPSELSAITPTPQIGSDILTLRFSATSGYGVQSSMPNTSADLKIDENAPIADGDILAITDCQTADVFQATNVATNNGGGNTWLNVVHNTGGALTPGNATHSFQKSYGPGSSVFRLQSTQYYVAPSAVQPNTNSLWKRTGTAAPEEVALGIDGIDLLFGEDQDGDYVANRYVQAGNVADFNTVVSVRVTLLASTIEDNVAMSPMNYTFKGTNVVPTDNKFHVVFTTTVNLRNRTP